MFSMPLPSLPWGHNRWSRQASAFVDNELAVASRADFERHLAGCPRCQQEVETLRSLKSLLVSNLPQVAAPRSFRLTPQMVAAPVVAPARRPVAVLRTAQVAAGLAVIALITVVTIDLTSSHSTGNTTSAH